MLTDLDCELFPDDCEVVSIPLHNQYIYLIQKNGSSSLRRDAVRRDWQILRNQDLYTLDTIDVYLRDPVERYLSGINTYVQHLLRDNADLDYRTCNFFATRYLFLNRHYLPQWHWLANLARFTHPTCELRLHDLADLSLVTDLRSRAGIVKMDQQQVYESIRNNSALEFWFLLDRILLGRCGQGLTWKEICKIYQEHPSRPLDLIKNPIKKINYVLS
jgi:hypothetical protein